MSYLILWLHCCDIIMENVDASSKKKISLGDEALLLG
jgi:hypothetical protein